MGMTCELRQISPAYAQKLLRNPDEVLAYYDDASDGELSEEAQGEDLDLDKSWNGLHYILTGTATLGKEPQCYLLMGGEQVGDEEDHDIGYGPARILLPQQVTAFQQVIAGLDAADVSARYNPAEMIKLDIYPNVWDRHDEQLEEWLQESLAELQGFLKRAVSQQRAVIIAML